MIIEQSDKSGFVGKCPIATDMKRVDISSADKCSLMHKFVRISSLANLLVTRISASHLTFPPSPRKAIVRFSGDRPPIGMKPLDLGRRFVHTVKVVPDYLLSLVLPPSAGEIAADASRRKEQRGDEHSHTIQYNALEGLRQ